MDAATASMDQGRPPNQKGVERDGKGDDLLHKRKRHRDGFGGYMLHSEMNGPRKALDCDLTLM